QRHSGITTEAEDEAEKESQVPTQVLLAASSWRGVTLGGVGEVHREIFSWQGHPRHIGVDHEVHLQWIPSHVDFYGNKVAEALAKQGKAEPLCSAPSLTFDEIYSIRKNKDVERKKTWRVPPSHDLYKRSSPGGSIGLACDRADQTALSRFVSGHLRSCSFSHGNKVFPVCAKCGVASASPENIVSCLRVSRETFETDPLLALDFLRVIVLMDGV
ncbi:hypothetical protein AVEN_136280-1, partial [Araneus ventricosus]